MPQIDDDKLYADVISISVEKALIDFGVPVLDKVELLLQSRYQMKFADAIKHPEEISEILQEVFGSSYIEVVNKIKDNLRNINFNSTSQNFVDVISNVR